MTGSGDPLAVMRTAGFAGHLPKPIDYDALVAMLDRLLGRRRQD